MLQHTCSHAGNGFIGVPTQTCQQLSLSFTVDVDESRVCDHRKNSRKRQIFFYDQIKMSNGRKNYNKPT